jgi:hypothetical protein
MTVSATRLTRAWRWTLVLGSIGMVADRAYAGQTPPAATWSVSAVNLTRFESWRYFEPPPGGGDPDYSFLGNRLRVEARGRWPRAEVTLAAQYAGQLSLPTGASGPGAFGTGALYFDQSGRHENPQEINGFLAHISGGPVVAGTFAGTRLWYGYVESIVTLGGR